LKLNLRNVEAFRPGEKPEVVGQHRRKLKSQRSGGWGPLRDSGPGVRGIRVFVEQQRNAGVICNGIGVIPGSDQLDNGATERT
jgi:hypothetical protein